MRKHNRVPPNVLAQEKQRRVYADEPEPEQLILVKSIGSNIRVKGSSGLMYSLSYPYLYIDKGDLETLDMVEEISEASISGDQGSITKYDTTTDALADREVGDQASKSSRPRQSKRSSSDGSQNNDEDGRVSDGDNAESSLVGSEEKCSSNEWES